VILFRDAKINNLEKISTLFEMQTRKTIEINSLMRLKDIQQPSSRIKECVVAIKSGSFEIYFD